MAEVSRAFASQADRAGRVIGVLPGSMDCNHHDGRPGYPNAWVEIPIRTHLPLSGVDGTSEQSRNHINILSSDLVIGLPGSDGTRSELELAISYGRPVMAFLENRGQLADLPAEIPVYHDLKALIPAVRQLLKRDNSTYGS